MLNKDRLLSMQEGIPLREAVYETLKDAILKGELAPGERMMEIPISNRLGVSRTPVREAIHRLEKDKLVIIQPKCGARVADITEKNVTDALLVRFHVEEMAVRLAATHPTKALITRLHEINEEIHQAVESQDIQKIFEKDNELHRVICEAADNQVLSRVAEFLEELVLRYRMEYVRGIEDCAKLTLEHQSLIDAIERQDANQAATALKNHIDRQTERICEMIRQRQEIEENI